MKEEYILLGCTRNGSDKQYKIVLRDLDDGCIVVGLYGKRGRLSAQANIAVGVPAYGAIKAADKVLASKLAKGYEIEAKSSGWEARYALFGVQAPKKPELIPHAEVVRAVESAQGQIDWF